MQIRFTVMTFSLLLANGVFSLPFSHSSERIQKVVSEPISSKDKFFDAQLVSLRAVLTPRQRFCAQPSNTNSSIDDRSLNLVKKEKARLEKLRKKSGRQAIKTVPTIFHVIHDGSRGNLSQKMVDDQINVLSSDYSSYGFQFNLTATNYVDNHDWFDHILPANSLQDDMKKSLRKGGKDMLNLYSVNFANNLLGYASFPWDVQAHLENDGVVFQYATVPGGSEQGYNLGKTGTHEVGHWLGLYHVFQSDCAEPGDFVEDTPSQSVATTGCPVRQDSCSGGSVDSIHNYMDYSTDSCLDMFSQGQAVRMAAMAKEYRGLG